MESSKRGESSFPSGTCEWSNGIIARLLRADSQRSRFCRLFFRFSTEKKIIIYVWVNDEKSLRKAGAKTDPYSLFQAMLRSGNPPQSLDHLLAASKELNEEERRPAQE
jgi:Toxin with endonuclease activity, of toxin-antitoxin system